MAIRERLRSLLRVHPRVEREPPKPLRAAPAPEPTRARVPAAVTQPGPALRVDLDEVGLIGIVDVKAPYVVVAATEAWRAAAAAELLQARGQSADWEERA
jgi:hypothetical protein